MENVVAVVRGGGGVERHGSVLPPVRDGAAQIEAGAAGDARVGGLDAEGEAPLRGLVDLGHDLVADVEALAWYDRLLRRDEELHELGRARRLAGGLPHLGDLVELPDGVLFVGDGEGDRGDEKGRQGRSAA